MAFFPAKKLFSAALGRGEAATVFFLAGALCLVAAGCGEGFTKEKAEREFRQVGLKTELGQAVQALKKGGGSVRGAREVLKKGIDPNLSKKARQALKAGEMPLSAAARAGKLRLARGLIEAGADPNLTASGAAMTPLGRASAAGHEGIVRTLIEAGADLSGKAGQPAGKTPLGAAIENNMTASARIILDAGLDLTRRADPYLIRAVLAGEPVIARELLKRGANPNVQVTKTQNAVNYAIARGGKEMVRVLESFGAER